MKVITEKELSEFFQKIDGLNLKPIEIYVMLKNEIKDSWIPLDEFLKSGLECEDCWAVISGKVVKIKFYDGQFWEDQYDYDGCRDSLRNNEITYVMPIIEPDMPKVRGVIKP